MNIENAIEICNRLATRELQDTYISEDMADALSTVVENLKAYRELEIAITTAEIRTGDSDLYCSSDEALTEMEAKKNADQT